MKKWLISLLFILIAHTALAQDLSFYIIYPEGEGDTDSAKPYLANLFDYIKETTGIQFNGLYLNDSHEATEAFKKNKVNLAIVSPEFYDRYRSKYHLNKILQTIPVYSTGPFERYYIMAGTKTKVMEVMEKQEPVDLYSSKSYDQKFLDNQIFIDNDQIKKIPWKLKETPDILSAIKEIASGNNNGFVLLTGYEFSIIKKLRKKKP